MNTAKSSVSDFLAFLMFYLKYALIWDKVVHCEIIK